MSYTALYRKLRPTLFNQIIGQEHIVTTLRNQILNNLVSHAYLFCGSRGTGKTSTAKVFAKALNCYNLHDAEPCNSCPSCLSIIEKRSMDVLEIDAASNNGVDNIREIIETVKYPPTEGRYKVYIIDETHMLSIGAFNALLKTLEDPPLFVVFILATTEYQKVPATIFSRCQRFDFRRIPYNTILTELNRYIAEQNINITKGSVEYIANMADGSLRDALSILDQCLATFLKPDITEDILEMFGGISHHVLADFLECLIRFDTIGSIKTINNVINSGKEVFQFITELLIYLRNLLLVKTVDNTSYPFNLSDERLRELKSQSQNVDEDRIVEYLDCFSGIRSKLRHSNEKILLEVMCIKLCKPEQLHDNNSQAIRLARLESLMEVDNGSASQGVQISEEDIIKQRLPFAEIR